MSADNLTANYEYIADSSAGKIGVGIFNQSGGTNTAGTAIYLGYNSTSTGTYVMSGGTLSVPGTDPQIGISEFIGFNGTGNFNQSGGTNAPRYLSLSQNGGSTGTYTLSGTGTLSVGGYGYLGMSGTAIFNQTGGYSYIGDEVVGYGGIGTVNQTGGISTHGYLSITGYVGGSTGTYTLSGTGSLSVELTVGVGGSSGSLATLTVDSGGQMTIDQYIQVHPGPNTVVNLDGGSITAGAFYFGLSPFSDLVGTSGTLDLTNESGFFGGQSLTIDSTSAGNFGDSAGTPSSFVLSAGQTFVVAGGENVGYNGTGTFSQSGGINSVGSPGLYIGYNAGSTGTYALIGTGSLGVSATEYVGYSGTGIFNQTGGTNTASGGVSIELAKNAGSTGTYVLSAGSIYVTGTEYVGGAGQGLFNQSGGANIIGGGLILELGLLGGTGTYLLSNTGSLTCGGNLEVGGSGSGTFNQSGGTTAITNNSLLFVAANSGSSGSFIVGGGTVNVSGSAYVGGSDTSGGGLGTMTVSGAGQLAVTGTLKVWSSGRVNLDVPSTSIGNLSIVGNGIVNLNGALQINYGSPGNDPIVPVVSYLQNGFNNGAWTGTSGIISTSVAAGSGKPLLSVGYADGNTDNGTPAGPNQIVVQYTMAGDANLDGFVNSADLLAVIQNFNKTGTDWSRGNFTYIASG